jgi:hypothetical protein
MSYSNTVKMQYYGVGLATGFLMACLVAGALFINAGAQMALNGLYVRQRVIEAPSLSGVSLENGLQGSSYKLQPAVNVK